MLEYLPQALGSLSAATNIISSLLGMRDFAKYATQLTELHGHIIKANSTIISEQQNHLTLIAKVQELEEECKRLKDWSAEKEVYTRRQIAKGTFAYVENKSDDLQTAHKLCCNCFEKSIKSTLQQDFEIRQGAGRMINLICPNGCPKLAFTHYNAA